MPPLRAAASCWGDHAGSRGNAGQDAAGPRRKLPVDQLALDLKADQQEEHGHQGVVDPVQDAQAANIGLENAEIDRRRSGIRHQQSDGRDGHQDDATR